MVYTKMTLDKIDLEILRILQEDCRTPISAIASQLNIPKSTIHYRIKRLEEAGVIEGCYAKVNPEAVHKDYLTITLVRARYGPGYHERVGKKLASIPGVWAVYFVLGEIDFVVLARHKNLDSVRKMIESFLSIEEIERTSTHVIVQVIKEDPRVEINIEEISQKEAVGNHQR